MFPSQGYFFSINCPDIIQGRCSRAYCHFIHNEKLLRSSSSLKINTSCENPLPRTQQVPSNTKQHSNIKSDANQHVDCDDNSDATSTPSLNNLPHVVSKQDVVVEVNNSCSSNETSPDLLTQLISEAVKKVLSENTAFNASGIDANSLIKSINTQNIVSKAVKDISSSQSGEDIYDPQPKLYLPPPGTPSYQPTPIKYLLNKNKPKENALPASSQEYTPIAINCGINAESNDDQVTDFSSADESDDREARSDFDMLEEVLVEKLSSDPIRNKAIQKRKKALGKSTVVKISSNSLVSKEKNNSKNVPKISPNVDKAEDSDSAFLPPSPIFTSSMKTNSNNVSSLQEQKPEDSVCSPYNYPCENNVSSDVTFTTNTSETLPGSSTHNLLPQIAELSRPNIKAWTPVAKVESLLSVEKMLEKLDRIEINKNLLPNNLTPNTSDSKDCPVSSEPIATQNSIGNDKQQIRSQREGKLNKNESNQVICTNKDGKDKEKDEKEKNDKSDSISQKRSSESDDVQIKERKKKESQDKKIDSTDENSNGERSSNRKRSLDSDSHSSGSERKRKRSSSSSKRKKKHKKKNISSEENTSYSEEEYYSSEEDAKGKRSKKKKKRKKHRSKRSKDRKKRIKREKSRSRKRKSSHERRSRSKSVHGSESDNKDKRKSSRERRSLSKSVHGSESDNKDKRKNSRERRSRSKSVHGSESDNKDKRKTLRDRSHSGSMDNSDSSEDKRKTVHETSDSSLADNNDKSSNRKKNRSHQRSRSNSAHDIDSHDSDERKSSVKRKSSLKSVDNGCNKNKAKILHEKRSDLTSAEDNDKPRIKHFRETKTHSKLDNINNHNSSSRENPREELHSKLVDGSNNNSSNSSVQERSNLKSSESSDRQKRAKRTSSHERSRLNSSDSIVSPNKKSKEMPIPVSNITATENAQVLLTTSQIKKEKIDVDLSIIKVEKNSCQASDNSKAGNTQHLSSVSRNDSSKDLSLGNVKNKVSQITIKTEKSIPSPLIINNNQAQTSFKKSIANSVPINQVSENISSIIKDTNSCNEIIKSSFQVTHLDKSSSTRNLVRTNSQSTTESLDISDSLTKSGLNQSSHKSKISSKRKLENYTSSLLQKVSDSLSSKVRTDAENSKSDESSKDGHNKRSKSPKLPEGSSKSKTLTEFSIFENLTEPSKKKRRKSSSSHKETENTSKSKEIKDVMDKRKSDLSSEDRKDKKSSNPHHERHKQKEEHSSASKHSSSSMSNHSISSTSKHSISSTSKHSISATSKHSISATSKHSISSTSKHSSHSSQKKREEHSFGSKSSSSKYSKTSVNKSEKHRHHEPFKSKCMTNRASDSDRRKSKDLKNNSSSGIKDKDLGKSNKENSKLSSGKDDPEGCDSPIPDLSALDELPKEDWDQLLSTSSNMENSDSDEGVDVNPSFDADYGIDDDDDDTDDINDPKVLEECMKVFSEYDPEKDSQAMVAIKEPQKQNIAENADEVPTRKNRVAYSGASGNLVAKPKALVKPHRKTPSEIMLERYRKLKEEEAALQKRLEMQRKELERHGRLPPSKAISSSSVSSSTDSVSSSSTALAKKRIGISSGKVDALLKSKTLLKSFLSSKKNTNSPIAQPQQTQATTVSKGAKRVAHTPKMETLERPVVSTEEGTKVPQNIRQRYLNCFIDETLKFCDGDAHAYNVALAEESICHKRATTRMVYLNLAVNTIKKLRSSQISEAAQELLESDPKYQETRHKKVSSVIPTSPSSKKFDHPINPNHRTMSHFSMMACGGQKGSWSIQKPKRSLPDNIKEYLIGNKFYKCLKKYILNVEALGENCFPRTDPSVKGKAILKKINSRKKISPSEIERYCDRCSVLYEVDTWGLPIGNSSCVYHWGRAYKSRGIGGLESKYSCCHGDGQSEGCCIGTTHVSENFSPLHLTGYVRTIPKSPASNGDYGVYALDCEMCYTTAGSELTRITVVDCNCKPVYETLVKPENPIIDYNTRFSGITESLLEGVTVKLRDVQAALLTRFSEKTILMGHSLESDFSALKIIHETVVDTSVVFPHKLGSPYKRALKNLASEILSKIIQNDEGGHDSAEDANTCMELMQWKVKEDFKLQIAGSH